MQKYIFLFFLIFVANFNFMQAQNLKVPVLEASEPIDGSTYYIQNLGLNLPLAAGGWWNTQAIVKTAGLPVTLRFNQQTNLYVLEFSSGNTLFRADSNGETYTDNTTNNKWNIQIKDADSLTYTIQAPSTYSAYNANQYLGTKSTMESTNNGNAYVVQYNRDKDEYARYIEWKFLNITLYEARTALYNALNSSTNTGLDITSYENIYENSSDPKEISTAASALNKLVFDYKISIATPENPVDLTYYLVNPGFDNNDDEGWVGAGTVNYHEVEFYQRTFDMYQEITGFPAGKYTLKAQGFERPKSNDSGAAYKAGTETIHAVLYAKTGDFPEKTTTFNSLYKHPYTGTTGALNGYANSMAAAEIMFADESNYEIIVSDIILGDGGSLTIGARSDFQQNGYWALFDNFRLEYEGFDINTIVDFVKEQIAIAQSLSGEKMQNTALIILNTAISQAQQTISADPLVSDDLFAANTQLLEAINAASISIAAYSNLQAAIDSAIVVYDSNGNEAAVLQTNINEAQTVSNNFDIELDEINDATDKLYSAIFVYCLSNPTGPVPAVVTNSNFARGATAAFGRNAVSGVVLSDILERGFCWSTHPDPTILDNRTTKYFNNNGNIYHIENLEPATVYYMRAYALTKGYAVGYGDAIKVITIPKGTVTYSLTGSVTGSGEHYPRIADAVSSAVDYFNNFTSIRGHHLTVSFSAGTPTAEASYGGYLQFGASPSYQRTGTALHEMGHTIGVGQHNIWYGPGSVLRADGSRGAWLGDRANKVVQFFENSSTSYLNGDHTHMWPYGINGASEDNGSEILYIANSLIHQAIGEDGLPPTGGFATPAYTFEHVDEIKYYIKNEAESRGRNTSFLVEDASGNLVYRTMNADEAFQNDSAAWYFSFVPATAYYRIRNAATGKYFTYRISGINGIGLASKETPAASENFQLMRARIDTKIGSGSDAFITRGYWIIRPQSVLNPPCFIAGANGTTSAGSFNLSNTATTQRWLLLTEEDVLLFEQALPVSSIQEVGVSGVRIFVENDRINITGISVASDIAIYDVSGRLQSIDKSVSDYYSQSVPKGVYIVSIRSTQYQDVKKVIVW